VHRFEIGRALAARLRIIDLASDFLRKEAGASLIEYALMLGLIAVVCLAAITLLGQDISSLFSRIAAPEEDVAPDSGGNNGKGKGKGKGKGAGLLRPAVGPWWTTGTVWAAAP
jgi:pilus assembly protein Flp/PilA